MKIKNLFAGMLVFIAAFFSTSVLAVPVTMALETLGADQSTPFSENGYSIVAPGSHLHATFSTLNFTNAANMAADTAGMKLTKNDAGQFDLISLDAINVLGLDATSGSFALQVDGLVAGAVQVSKQLFSGTTGLVNFLSDSALWGGLDEVQFWYESQPTGFGSFSAFAGDDFKFDNIVVEPSVSAVPVPAAVWLFFSALGSLGIMRKKQTAIA